MSRTKEQNRKYMQEYRKKHSKPPKKPKQTIIGSDKIIENTYSVYYHINKINNKVYVGCTTNPKHRFQPSQYKRNKHFANDIEKYGWNNFKHIIVASGLSQQVAYDLEITMIALLDTTNLSFGYNIQTGGKDYKVAQETRNKISKANIGKSKNKIWVHNNFERKRVNEEDLETYLNNGFVKGSAKGKTLQI